MLRIWKAAVDNLATTPMDDETWRGLIIISIPPTMKWLPVIPGFYSMTRLADIISTLSAHGMILGQEPGQRASSSPNTTLSARTTQGCTNPNCKANKRTMHTTPDCYWPGGGKEGQFPPNFGQRAKANTASSTVAKEQMANTENQPATETFALSVQILHTPGHSGVVIEDDPTPHPHLALISKGFQKFKNRKVPTFMDSGASDTMFVSRDIFTNYTPISSHIGDSAKANDGNSEIVGEGTVLQHY